MKPTFIFSRFIYLRSVELIRTKYNVSILVIAISVMGLLSIFRNVNLPTTASTVVTVKSGDSLQNLSDKYNVFISILEKDNHKYSNDDLLVGDRLLIPNQHKNEAKPSTKPQTSKKSKTSHPKVDPQAAWNRANADAKAWISFHESTDSYTATNGQYYGRYQLDRNYLNGDFSPSNQERVAEHYVSDRYGSWVNAKAHWVTHNWY